MRNKPPLALILGSGFSKEFGLPTTQDLSKQLLDTPEGDVLSPRLENLITRIIREFWIDVFGYKDSCNCPSLEDHFTCIDLSANTGHSLGPKYDPKKLRAIRRMSIHRIFQLLDKPLDVHMSRLHSLMNALTKGRVASVLTMNWDVVAERGLGKGVDYGIDTEHVGGSIRTGKQLVLKLHGSSNWVYCECCRQTYWGTDKTALRQRVLISPSDFKLFRRRLGRQDQKDLVSASSKCEFCGYDVGTRVATFSYRKDLSLSQFQSIWETAGKKLSRAREWLIIGYSLPEADFELRHLLKRSQLARELGRSWSCRVVLYKDDNAERRYRGFFGNKNVEFHQGGLADWVQKTLKLPEWRIPTPSQ